MTKVKVNVKNVVYACFDGSYQGQCTHSESCMYWLPPLRKTQRLTKSDGRTDRQTDIIP